jgi:hypothetical protein
MAVLTKAATALSAMLDSLMACVAWMTNTQSAFGVGEMTNRVPTWCHFGATPL